MLGEVLGNYRVLRQLGEGGMGVVYYAEHTLIGTRAAIKVLQPDLSANRDMVARFFNEARAAALINHPGLVQVFDFGVHDSGRAFLVMELLQGESLSARLARERFLPVETLLAIARQIASAVGAAHDAGIIHRDLKPDNVFLVPDREVSVGARVKILDFGIAKLGGSAATTGERTRTGSVMGTPNYMSPEQCRGAAQVDARADLYSLGCILYEMACGRRPFIGELPGDVIAAHLRDSPIPPRAIVPALPPALEVAILRLLAKRPDERQPTMGHLLAELDAVSRWPSRPPGVSPTAPPNATPPMPSNTTLSSAVGQGSNVSAGPRQRAGARIAIAAGAAVVVVAVAVGVGIGLANREARPEPSLASPTPASMPAEPAALAPAPAPAPPPAPRRVKLAIESDPAGADVLRDPGGQLLGTTPYVHEMEASEGAFAAVLRREGFEDARAELSAAQDGTTRIALTAKPEKPVKPAAARSKTRPKSDDRIKTETIDPFD